MSETRSSKAARKRPSIASAEAARSGDDVRSPVSWLVLALLIEQPSHGYELSRRYDERFGEFAALSVPRVYAALDRLRDSGMIEPIVINNTEPARKQHLMRRSYRATASGEQAYRSWVSERMRDDPGRPQLLARIASSGALGLDAVLDVIERYERACVEDLRALPTPGDPSDAETGDLQQLTDFLVNDQQRRELRARYEWAISARRVVEARREQGGASEQS